MTKSCLELILICLWASLSILSIKERNWAEGSRLGGSASKLHS